jgi:[NiFe] hydrogenase assembly HybE family chaperone
MNATEQARVAQLERAFAHIGATRMQGVPVLNGALRVQAVGFERVTEATAPVLLGMLITPWFMNLLRLPLARDATAAGPTPGSKRSHPCGAQVFEFIAAHEEALGSFEACSMFSPMFEFADQAGALSTATEILTLLRAPPAPSRRGFLLGRVRPGAAP